MLIPVRTIELAMDEAPRTPLLKKRRTDSEQSAVASAQPVRCSQLQRGTAKVDFASDSETEFEKKERRERLRRICERDEIEVWLFWRDVTRSEKGS